ncbi:Sip5p NDAI_0H02970 [Naumovozyma dairenensis CBS 421]|uniref:Protein SIP5 n=1 Tax=Naumovozyma dairenensis (strain ATCC 10597 / BCRC 20456 / CBS 421 / NBRC 0211 / NRRL Y-12639) TaxID=1071378 RepID=G0WFA9_NAUDC|nr:hypothetical protein NDAI_0H02970 [Naumovozyma dairenensis CBS 421]CCD26470.1 hypothetical protein NDAI_0H02970 [Naumovozyma dairenensis CBS 421]
MGNVPGKLDQDNIYFNQSGRGAGTQSNNASPEKNRITRNRRAVSLVNSVLATSRTSTNLSDEANPNKRRSTREREALKEEHAKGLVVKYNETVDGGYLAPYGVYSVEKLDYDVQIVKKLIVDRKLAPFYTPLQDFDKSWTKEEVIKIINGLPLHSTFSDCIEEFDGVPTGNLKRANFDDLIDRSLSKKEQRREHSKIFKARLYKKRVLWQEGENELFLEKKIESRSPNSKPNQYLPSDDLKYEVYRNGNECPICFLYFPEPLNYSKCCLQPICTECFVQIKRSEPHFPHEEIDPMQPAESESEKDPNLLTSEPATCPYCATPDFSIMYCPPKTRRTGLGGIPPIAFKSDQLYIPGESSNSDGSDETNLRSRSKSVEGSAIISADSIRPDWENKLKKERMRLMKRSNNATAIHISNRLVQPEHRSRNGSTPGSSSPTTTGANETTTINELEEQMVEEAIKLSLEDNGTSGKKKKKRSQTLS